MATCFEKPDSGGGNGSREFLRLGSTDVNGAYRIVMKFDVSCIPSGSTIHSAKLSLFRVTTIGDDSNRVFRAHRITEAWAEQSIESLWV